MKLNNKKGISLIVLVITIIVMIILAAAIILSLQSSGIIGKANEAKVKNDIASAKELVTIANSEWLLMTETEQKENGETFVVYAEEKLEDAGYNPDELVVSENGTVEECVALIGTVKYATLQAAIDDVKTDDTETEIKITKDIIVTNTIKMLKHQFIKLDLNGRTISSEGMHTIRIHGYTTLHIVDSSENKEGKIIAKSDKSKYREEYDVDKDGVVSELDAKPLAEYLAGMILDEDMPNFDLYDTNDDGKLDGIDASNYAALYNSVYAINGGGTVKISINQNNIIGDTVAIYTEDIILE